MFRYNLIKPIIFNKFSEENTVSKPSLFNSPSPISKITSRNLRYAKQFSKNTKYYYNIYVKYLNVIFYIGKTINLHSKGVF